MSEPYDLQALDGAAEVFEELATGANPHPLALAQAIRSVAAALRAAGGLHNPADAELLAAVALSAMPNLTFTVQPMDTAPSGDDALEPSEIEVHEGAWSILIGTNAKPIGWIDTHATFAGETYRDRMVGSQ